MVSERRVFLTRKGGGGRLEEGRGNSRPHQSAYTSISVGPFATCVCDGGGKALGTVGEGRTNGEGHARSAGHSARSSPAAGQQRDVGKGAHLRVEVGLGQLDDLAGWIGAGTRGDE